MEKHITRLRPARPERDDGLLFARYMDAAAEGFFRFMLGRNVGRIIADAFPEPGHTLSYEHVTFAEHDGVVVGMTSGYTGARHRDFTEEPLRRAAGRGALRMRCVRALLAPVWRILEAIPAESFYLQGIAVEPELRGAGIGSLLLDDVERRARAGGCAHLCLHVSASNHRARKLYARRGMVEASRWPAAGWLPTVFILMSMDL